jgi:hypothetical protein
MNRSIFVVGLFLTALCANASSSSVAAAAAVDLTKIDRHIKKEPGYTSKSPLYTLLVIGPEARDRVWIVKDGDVLYVDHNGNGDLTEPSKKLLAKKRGSTEDGHSFTLEELNVGGKKHGRLRVGFLPLKSMMFGEFAKRADAKAILTKDPKAEMLVLLSLEVTAPHLKTKGRVLMAAGGFDLNGPLVPARKASEAPIIHFGGPLQVNFNDQRPTLRRNRSVDFMLVVGTPGLGAGTFAAIGYDETIPSSVYPQCEITYSPAREGATPVKKLYELKERC